MKSTVEQYTDEIHDELGYWATWMPNKTLELGTCGPLRGRELEPEATLADFGVEFEVEPGSKPIGVNYASKGGVSWRVQAAGSTGAAATIAGLPPGSAGIEVAFSRAHAVVLVVADGREHRIRNIHALRTRLLELAASNAFPREYAVVTDVVVAKSAAVLISKQGQTTFTASAKTDLSQGLLELAHADASLSRVSSAELETELVGIRGATPLFKVVGFKKGGLFWGKPSFARLGFDDGTPPDDVDELVPGDADAD